MNVHRVNSCAQETELMKNVSSNKSYAKEDKDDTHLFKNRSIWLTQLLKL